MSRDINELDKSIIKKAKKAVADMKKDKLLKTYGVTDIYINETRRELAVQMAYYSRSRMTVDDVKEMYKAAGLYALSDAEAKIANTWTLKSKHIEGKAIDLVPVRAGKLWWTAPACVWERMGVIGENAGLNWGGRWKEKDLPHFEGE